MHHYPWAVIGAGPAGIASVGQLIDHGVSPKDIIWLDSYFQAGDLGRLWTNVPSNTQVKLFHKFLKSSKAFAYNNAPKNLAINSLNPEDTCQLKYIAEALQWVSQHLLTQVASTKCRVEEIQWLNKHWQLRYQNKMINASRVILAVGAEPRSLKLSSENVIPLDVAMDREKLTAAINKQQTIAVFGSSHSAVLVLWNLVDAGVKKIINFYRSPLRYAVYLKEGILFDNSGLKGEAAVWAKQHLEGELPANLERVYSNDQNIMHYLPRCDQAIYAVGFSQRRQPFICGYDKIDYEPHTGIIAPGLFGVGIAYPEKSTDVFGIEEYRVGLWKFMEYLQRILPLWLQYNS